jgi:alkaline phosphatase
LNQPSLTEMAEKALEILKKNKNGFVLLVEGGRIDTAHHETTAQLALGEVVEFQKAVQLVKDNTNEDETLIVVTSDHSTVLTVGGYLVS